MTAPPISKATELDQLCINTIRTLSMDAVQAANSGHPGTPMAHGAGGLLPVAALSALRPGGSDLAEPRPLRALGRARVDAALFAAAPDRREGRQPRSTRRSASRRSRSTTSSTSASSTASAPGHPEYRWTSGVETTTGPLGQGMANSVGMAIGGALAGRALTTSPASTLFDYDVYALCGDGCMMEGICQRGGFARRPPGARQPLLDLRQQPHHHRGQHRTGLQRGRGHALHRLWLECDARRRRQRPGDARRAPSRRSTQTSDRPTLIIVDSHIGYGAPHKQDTSAAHGEPLGEEEIRLAKRSYGWPEDAQVPGARRRAPSTSRPASASAATALRDAWMAQFEAYREQHPELADELVPHAAARAARRLGPGPADFPADAKGLADPRLLGPGAERGRAATCPG